MKQRLFSSTPLCINWLAVVRVFTGLLIAHHGLVLFNSEAMTGTTNFFASIHIPLPEVMAYVSKATEFFGGLLLIIGLFTRFVSGILVFNMFVALWTGHHFEIFTGGESAFLFLLLFAVFAAVGGGALSVDRLLFGTYSTRR